MLSDRQNNLFQSIVETYVATAVPVGSELLCERAHVDVSSATVRAEMNCLEQEGYLLQPFTSAGRVPTQKGYEYYVENMLDRDKPLPKKDQALLQKSGARSQEREQRVKNIAKGLALCTGASVMVGFGVRDTYYTGISNLFSNPEFEDYNLACSISAVVDRLDESIGTFFGPRFKDIQILIGQNNPLHKECSIMVGELDKNVVIGVFGPMRMDYQKNYSALSFVRGLL